MKNMKNMKNTKKFLLATLLYTIFLLNSSTFYIFANNLTSELNQETSQENLENLDDIEDEDIIEDDDPLNLVAGSAILIDADTGIILYEKNKDRQVYPASTTKVITSLLTIENKNMNDLITHTEEAFKIGAGSSHIGMRLNESISTEDALHGILLASANEVSMAVAENIAGTVDGFVDMMNERAYEIGAVNTHFANPHGFHDDDHYTTPYDMSLLFQEALTNDVFKTIINTSSYVIPVTNIVDEQRYLNNSNKLISSTSPYYYQYAIGGKTGYTSQAGNTLVSYAEKDGVNLICVVMENVGFNTYIDSKTLFEYGFSLYSDTMLFDKSDYKAKVNVVQEYNQKYAELGDIYITAEKNISIKLPSIVSKTDITQVSNISNPLLAPVSIGDPVGSLDFYLDDLLLSSVELVASQPMALLPESTLLKEQIIQDLKTGMQKILGFLSLMAIGLLVASPIIYTMGKKITENKRKQHRIQYLDNKNNNNNNLNSKKKLKNNNFNFNNNKSTFENRNNNTNNINANNNNSSSRVNRINRANNFENKKI